MPKENVEIVRRIYEDGVCDHHPDQILALAASNVEYVNPPEAVDPGVRRGTHEVARGGKIVRFEWGRDLKAALEAAGLRE